MSEPATEPAAPPAAEPAVEPGAHAKERSRRAILTTLSAVAGRGLGFVLSFISLPLTIGYLDVERYGLWMTIGSFLAWLSIADLGLGNGLSNAVTKARALGDHDHARGVVSTAFVLLGAIAVLMAIVFAAVFSWIPWARVFAVSSRVDPRELTMTIALCHAVFAVSFPLGIVDRVLGACQEGYLTNYFSSANAVLTTIALGNSGVPQDCQTVAYAQLGELAKRIDVLLTGRPELKLDSYSRAHLEETASRIRKVLDAKVELKAG